MYVYQRPGLMKNVTINSCRIGHNDDYVYYCILNSPSIVSGRSGAVNFTKQRFSSFQRDYSELFIRTHIPNVKYFPSTSIFLAPKAAPIV